MSACALRRWGSPCLAQRPPDTPVAKEMEKSLQSMISERNKQDTMWLEVLPSNPSNPSNPSKSLINPPNR